MGTEATLELDALIQPFSDDKPAGEDVREDFSPTSIYYQIKDARAAARTAERQNLMSDDPAAIYQKVTEWDTVLELAPKILTEHGKDLEIAAWYIEALIRAYGFAGLRDGLRLVNALIDKFWDDLYPLPDEDGIETRVSPLTGLNGDDGDGTLIGPIKQVLLTDGYTDGGFAAWQYEQAYEIETIVDPDKKEARIAQGGITLKTIENSVLETGASFFISLIEDLDECIEEFSNMSSILDEKCGHDAPPTSNIRNALKRVKEIIGFLTKDVLLSGNSEETQEDESPQVAQAGGAVAVSKPKTASIENVSINSRDEAFRALLKVSDFFKRTEPHSPISYNLNQAVKWGRMSLPELLGELIPDERAREEYFKLAGISTTQETE